jgi:hypothetical protein
MASIYIETSIVSYLRERQASHVVAAARQLLTKRWWSDERKKYTLANARTLPIIQRVLRDHDVVAPLICTPENLMSDDTQLDD